MYLEQASHRFISDIIAATIINHEQFAGNVDAFLVSESNQIWKTNHVFDLFQKEKEHFFLEKVRFVLNFLRKRRFLVRLKFVKTGNWKDLWKSIADKKFLNHETSHLCDTTKVTFECGE